MHGGITCGGGGRTAIQRQRGVGAWADIATAGGAGGYISRSRAAIQGGSQGGSGAGLTQGDPGGFEVSVPTLSTDFSANLYSTTLDPGAAPCVDGFWGPGGAPIPPTPGTVPWMAFGERGRCVGGSGGGFCVSDRGRWVTGANGGGGFEYYSAGGTSFISMLECASVEPTWDGERVYGYDGQAGRGVNRAQGQWWMWNQ